MRARSGSRTRERLDPQLLALAGTLLIGAVASLLDSTIVSVALHDIGAGLHASETALSWVNTSYLLTLALVTPFVGWVADRYGEKRTWMWALAVFLAGSVLCGSAWNVESLIVFRVVKGVGGGTVLPLVQAILAQAAGPQRFGRVMSLVGVPGQLAPVLGPVVGGLLVDAAGWRWVFLVNVPVLLVALTLARRVLPDSAPRGHAAADRLGMLLLPPGMVALVYGFSRVREVSQLADPVTLGILVAGLVLIAAFCAHSARSADPLVDVRLFRSRVFTTSSMLIFLHGVAVYGPLLVLPLFFSRVLGHDSSTTGWLLAPQGLGMLLGILLAGRLTDRHDPRTLVLVSTVVSVLGTAAFTQLDRTSDATLPALSLCVRGLGLGVIGVAVITAAYRDIPAARIPRGTVMIAVGQRIGASFGTAAVALLLSVGLSSAPGGTARADAAAYGTTFWWVLALVAAMSVPALLMPRKPAATEAGTEDTGLTADGRGGPGGPGGRGGESGRDGGGEPRPRTARP